MSDPGYWDMIKNGISRKSAAVDVETPHTENRRSAVPPQRLSTINRNLMKIQDSINIHHKTSSTKFIWGTVIALLVMSLIMFIVWFEYSPESYSYSNGIGKTPSEHRLNGLYYWCTLTSTVGFGDICPITPNAKGITSLHQIFITLLSLGVLWNITDSRLAKLVPDIVKK